jgi:hypothetical protein
MSEECFREEHAEHNERLVASGPEFQKIAPEVTRDMLFV